MNKYKLNINYDFEYSEEDKKDLDSVKAQTSESYITYAVNTKYKEGIEGQKRRVWGRIQRKLDEAIDNKTYEVSLEESEKDFIKEAFRDAKYPPNFAKGVNQFEDEFIESLAKKDEEKK